MKQLESVEVTQLNVEIPRDLKAAVKVEAAKRGIPLKGVVAVLLAYGLRRAPFEYLTEDFYKEN